MTEQKEITKKCNTPRGKANGRPRVVIAPDLVLNAWEKYRSVNRAARELGITPGTCFNRLKELGICPLGMTRSESGRFGHMLKVGMIKPVKI